MSVTIILALSLFGLAVAFYYSRSVSRVAVDMGVEDADTRSKLRKIHSAIAEGAMAFLKQEYKFMAIFMVLFGIVIALLIDDHHTTNVNEGIYTAVAFIFGAIISIASGYIGMKIATAGNVRTTVSANQSLSGAFNVALHSGAVMGFALVSLASLGLLLIYLGLKFVMPDDVTPHVLMEVIAGFGLGGSSIALFARVGGGIFTKAADVGADLVGKVEAGIPEDDPRNPAVIADNVGDNVGDVAGMGADLFGSCAESTCAAMVISAIAFGGNVDALLYPIVISAIGIPVSLITIMMIRVKTEAQVGPALKRMLIISSTIMAAVMYFVTDMLVPAEFAIAGVEYTSLGVYLCFLTGLIAGLVVGLITEYYTSDVYSPVREVAESCQTGAATNIIFGLALGYKSAVGPYLAIGLAIYIPWMLAGMYGIAIASLGMLGTLVIALTIDAYGPVADNAGGIAEMAGMPEHVRERTDVLDSAGNTTAAIGKGFAIGAAILTSLALFGAFLTRADLLMKEQRPGLGSSRLDQPARPNGLHRPVHRCRNTGAVLSHDDEVSRRGRIQDDRGSAASVPRRSGHHGGHQRSRPRTLRRDLDTGCYSRNGSARHPYHGCTARHRVPVRHPGHGRTAGRLAGRRRRSRDLGVKLGRCLGQRQEVHRSRQSRWQGHRRSQSGGGWRYGGRSAEGHVRPVAEYPDQVVGHSVARLRTVLRTVRRHPAEVHVGTTSFGTKKARPCAGLFFAL